VSDNDAALINAAIGRETVLDTIPNRVLWLSTAMIHHANRVRAKPDQLKVGGHQASSASMVTIMTSLYFEQLHSTDRVSVKPHASPVLHSINYLLGFLDEKYMTTLREFDGLQSYPSRAKDPDPIDYSTGSVGIGATAPIWGSIARRYVQEVFGSAGTGRQYSLLGDAELDEGAVWEAILDPSVQELGEIVWIIDMNPSVPGSRRAQHRGRTFGVDVLRRGMAGHHRPVRTIARGPVHPPRRRGIAPPHPGHAQPGISAPAALHRTRIAGSAARSRPRRGRNRAADRRTRR